VSLDGARILAELAVQANPAVAISVRIATSVAVVISKIPVSAPWRAIASWRTSWSITALITAELLSIIINIAVISPAWPVALTPLHSIVEISVVLTEILLVSILTAHLSIVASAEAPTTRPWSVVDPLRSRPIIVQFSTVLLRFVNLLSLCQRLLRPTSPRRSVPLLLTTLLITAVTHSASLLSLSLHWHLLTSLPLFHALCLRFTLGAAQHLLVVVSVRLVLIGLAVAACVLAVRALSPAVAHVAWLAFVGCIVAANDRIAGRACHVGGLVALLALHDVELDSLVLAYALLVLVGVVLDDGGLVNEDVLVGVVAVDEAVAVLDVEPLDDA
jgi:hypothetical protein